MSRIQQYQASFTIGEIDPLLKGRIDLQQYYTSVASAKNVIFEPQGGFSRRPGLKFLTDITADGAANGHYLAPFEFSIDESFMVCMTALKTDAPNPKIRLKFFKDGALITGINGTSNDYLDYTVSNLYNVTNYDLQRLSFTQSADTLIIVHPNFAPFKVVRGTTDTSWTASLINDLVIPKHNFSITTTNPQATLEPSAVDGTITLTASASVWLTSHVDQFVEADDGFGRARIIEYTSGTVVKAFVEVPFFNKDPIAIDNWVLETGYEDSWSDTRGWPVSATFHEGRLYFGGSASLPSTLFGSKVSQFFNFKAAEGLDDDAIKITLATDSVNTITGMRSGRDLQIFTTGAEFFVPQGDLDPITPSNVVAKSSTKRGAKAYIRPQAAEGGTLFIQRQGKAVRELLFSDVELSYVANNISLLASHLIVDPQKLALRPSTDTTEGDLLLILNGADSTDYRSASLPYTGMIAAFVLNKGQNIVAPSHLQTDGTFVDIAVDVDTIYTIVKRSIGGSDKYYVEVFNDDFTTDSSLQKTTGFSGTAYTGYSHLEGKTVKVIRDDAVDPDDVVSSGGIATSVAPTGYTEVGLDFDVEVITNPVETKLPSGTIASMKKRILEISPRLYKTQNITINNRDIPLSTMPLSGAGKVPTYTGIKKTAGFLGFTNEAQITITQTQPVFMTVLSLDYKVSIGQ
jgi:hypothetical protein